MSNQNGKTPPQTGTRLSQGGDTRRKSIGADGYRAVAPTPQPSSGSNNGRSVVNVPASTSSAPPLSVSNAPISVSSTSVSVRPATATANSTVSITPNVGTTAATPAPSNTSAAASKAMSKAMSVGPAPLPSSVVNEMFNGLSDSSMSSIESDGLSPPNTKLNIISKPPLGSSSTKTAVSAASANTNKHCSDEEDERMRTPDAMSTETYEQRRRKSIDMRQSTVESSRSEAKSEKYSIYQGVQTRSTTSSCTQPDCKFPRSDIIESALEHKLGNNSVVRGQNPQQPVKSVGLTEGFEDLVNVSTVPEKLRKEFHSEYLDSISGYNKREQPPGAEDWKENKITRLEFRNISVKVMKPKKKQENISGITDKLQSSLRFGPDQAPTPMQMKKGTKAQGTIVESDDEEDFVVESDEKKGWCGSGDMECHTILDNLSGVIEPGKMVAIMGASGAGKTTLLNALSGRITQSAPEDAQNSLCTGGVFMNGTRVTEEELTSTTGYVMQEDVLLGTQTARETFQFAARTQQPARMSVERKHARAERLLQQLDLMHIGNSPIGTSFVRGISGGERRRVSVGVEMVRDPPVLFLDEPTSGLDSSTAVKIMRVLKHVAQTGRTIIFTIHSPNSTIVSLFDTLILLCRGKQAYFGPSKQALNYFAGFGYACPTNMNSAEFFQSILQYNNMEVLKGQMYASQNDIQVCPFDPRYKIQCMLKAHAIKSGECTTGETSKNDDDLDEVVIINGKRVESAATKLHRVATQFSFPDVSTYMDMKPWQVEAINNIREEKRQSIITDAYLQLPVQRDNRINPFLRNYVPEMRIADKNPDSEYTKPGIPTLPYHMQLKEQTIRTVRHVIRQPVNTFLRLAVNIFLSIFVGIQFYQTGDKQQSVYARVGFQFFMTSIQAFQTTVATVLTFADERALFLREKIKCSYHTSTYFLGRTFVDIILQTILSIIFGLPAYWMVGLQNDNNRFIQFTIAMVLIGQSSQSYALILGALVPYRTIALMLSPLVMVPFMMTTGFFVTMNSMPRWLMWLADISPQRFIFEAIMGVEFTELRLKCDATEMITVPLDNGRVQRFCPFERGEDVCNIFGLKYDQYWFDIFITLLLAIAGRVLSYACLRFSAYRYIKQGMK